MTGTLVIRSSPHFVSGAAVDRIMFQVALALAPTTLWAIWTFGLTAAVTLGTAVATCLVTERLLAARRAGRTTLGDGSALVTGLLYGLTLPPGLALWMVAVGGVVAMALGKLLFGGLGQNPFNPALVGRAFLQAAFPVSMTTWVLPGGASRFTELPSSSLALPLMQPTFDGLSGATPLSAWKFDAQAAELSDLVFGSVSGSVGETSALLILLGGLYLGWKRYLDWRIPTGVLGSAALLALVLWLLDSGRFPTVPATLFSGGLMLGAVFMATDMVGSPITPKGTWIYAALIGCLVVLIRNFGGMPEGVMYAILLGNACTPLLDKLCKPRVYGHAKVAKGGRS